MGAYLSNIYVFLKVYLFILERTNMRMRACMGGDAERENSKQTSLWAQSPLQGSISAPWGHDLSWN